MAPFSTRQPVSRASPSGVHEAGVDGFDHHALLYNGLDRFVEAAVPFITAGLHAEEAVLVVVPPDRISALREALGADASTVRFTDMTRDGRNPARILDIWQRFIDGSPAGGMRGIGEPVYAERRADELEECALHERLINHHFPADIPMRLMCPYDVGSLDESVIAAALHSHPQSVAHGTWQTGAHFHDEPIGPRPFARPLPPPPPDIPEIEFDGSGLRALRALVEDLATSVGVGRDRAGDIVLAVNEVAANSVRHGGRQGRLRMWVADDQMVFEISDDGVISDPVVGRIPPAANEPGGRGLWLANQLCELVRIHSTDAGTTIRLQASVA